MMQGDVYWYTFREPDKRRPVVVLTRSVAIPHLSAIVVAQVTTTIRNLPSFVALDENDGMEQPCAINLDTLQLVQKDKFGTYITHLSPVRLQGVRDALQYTLNMDTLGT